MFYLKENNGDVKKSLEDFKGVKKNKRVKKIINKLVKDAKEVNDTSTQQHSIK